MVFTRGGDWLAIAAVATATSVAYVWLNWKEARTTKEDAAATDNVASVTASAVTPNTPALCGEKGFDETLIREQLARNYAFFGEERMEKVRDAYVVVCGLGGVGSWAAVMLARSGIGKLMLVDFDQVSLSSLNRHAVATLVDVGKPKALVMRDSIQRMTPWIKLDARIDIVSTETLPKMLSERPSFVVDAIDNVKTKVQLLAYCKTNDIPVIASMGSGCKSDISRIHVDDLAMTIEDPLSRMTRRLLRENGITSGIPVVFSSEKPDPKKAALLPLDQSLVEDGNAGDYSVLPDFRARILPVVGTMPGVFGLNCANYVLMKIAGYPMEPLTFRNRYKVYGENLSSLSAQSEKVFNTTYASPFALDQKIAKADSY